MYFRLPKYTKKTEEFCPSCVPVSLGEEEGEGEGSKEAGKV